MDLCCRRRWGAHCELMSAGQWETVDVVDGRGAASGSWRRLPSQGTSTTTTSPPAQEQSMPRVAQVRTRPRAARGGRDEGQVLLLRVGGVGGQLLLLLAGGEGGPLNSGVGFSCNNQPTGWGCRPGGRPCGGWEWEGGRMKCVPVSVISRYLASMNLQMRYGFPTSDGDVRKKQEDVASLEGGDGSYACEFLL